MDNFYVYMYLRSKNSVNGTIGSPYYIGKGHGKRAFAKHGNVPLPNDKSKIIILFVGLSEEEANAEEKRQIALYGRIDLGTGCLRNRTNGGEGQCGVILSEERKRYNSEWMKAHPNDGNRLLAITCHTSEARAKAAASNRGKKRSDEFVRAQSERMKGKSHPAWNKGIPRTEEQRKQHSELLTGRKQTLEAVAKRAAANKESSLKMFGCTGHERRKMRRRERYAELQAEGRGYQKKR